MLTDSYKNPGLTPGFFCKKAGRSYIEKNNVIFPIFSEAVEFLKASY